MYEPCMCGAEDCKRCFPGYKPPKQCDNCFEESYELTAVYDGDELCEACLDDYLLCDWCGEYHKPEDVKVKECGDKVCDDCEDDYEEK